MAFRPPARWPLILAVVFCAYSLLLLWHLFQSREERQAAVDARLIADSKRRAAALGDLVADQRKLTSELARAHETRNYLSNKALGMSPQYGLNASLDAIEKLFREQIEKRLTMGPTLQRILFLDEKGGALVDTDPGQGPLQPPDNLAGESLTLDADQGWIIMTAPVPFRGTWRGTLITVGKLAYLYRFLIHLETGGTYRETLLTAGGREMPATDGAAIFAASFVPRLLELPEDRPMPLSNLTLAAGEPALRDVIAIKSRVVGIPLALVTTMSAEEIYGRLNAPLLLYSLGVFPILVLLGALWVDRLQARATHLSREAARSDSHRQELQGQNAALAEEIRRREAVERELHHHQNHLEELVARGTAELNGLFLALPDLYFRLRRDGTVLDYRAGNAADLFLAPEDFLGKRLPDLLPPEIASQLLAALDDMAAGKAQCVYEYGLPMPAGQQFYEARMLPLDQEQLVVVVRNITERRVLEAAREANRLEAERLARVKSEFLANMSHEIRTPLNGILGMAQIGYRESLGRAKSQDAFARILQSGNLLLGIINDILDLSKIEAGRLRLESVPMEPRRLLEHAREIVADRAQDKGIALSVRVTEAFPKVCLGDPLRLEQVLLNLLANAVKFTDQGSVLLAATREGEQLVFEVTDTGIGMDETALARLFAPFQQADGGTTRRFGGTGLGLVIARRLTELMGGRIQVRSQVGQGTCFEVRIPFQVAPEQALAPDAGVHPVSDLTRIPSLGPRLAGLNLLVAEDTEINQLVLRNFLENEGARVVLVADGRQAWERVTQDGPSAYDLILMDIQMPDMDGYEATRRIRAIAPEPPIVGQTAHALAEERAKCLDAGMVDHVAKPIELENLVAVVLRHARGEPSRAVPANPPALGSPTPEGPSPIDWAALQARLGGRRGFAERLAATFLESQRETPAKLRDAIAAEDLRELVRVTHQLKGVVGNLALPEFHELTAQAEQAARRQDAQALTMARGLIQPLEHLLARTEAYLAEHAP